jgi:hypothetical protein
MMKVQNEVTHDGFSTTAKDMTFNADSNGFKLMMLDGCPHDFCCKNSITISCEELTMMNKLHSVTNDVVESNDYHGNNNTLDGYPHEFV